MYHGRAASRKGNLLQIVDAYLKNRKLVLALYLHALLDKVWNNVLDLVIFVFLKEIYVNNM